MENDVTVSNQPTPEVSIAELAAKLDNPNPAPEATPAETERLAAKYAEAARRNQAARAKQREIKAPLLEKESEIEKYKAEIERLKKYEDVSDPMELLKLKGMSYEDLINKNLNPEEFDTKAELQKLRDEIAAYKTANETKEKEVLERQKGETIESYIKHVQKFTQSLPEEYELINTLGHHRDVYEVIELTHAQTGKVLTDKEAADLVEQYLQAEHEKKLDQYLKINKLKGKVTPITDENQLSDQYSEAPTLSNQLTSTTSATRTKLSEEEELKRAASFIKWT